MNFTWKINQLERNSTDGFVTYVDWSCIGEYEDFYFEHSDSVLFTGTPIIQFEKLTEEIVLSWVWQVINKDDIESAIIKKFNNHKKPAILQGLPW